PRHAEEPRVPAARVEGPRQRRRPPGVLGGGPQTGRAAGMEDARVAPAVGRSPGRGADPGLSRERVPDPPTRAGWSAAAGSPSMSDKRYSVNYSGTRPGRGDPAGSWDATAAGSRRSLGPSQAKSGPGQTDL